MKYSSNNLGIKNPLVEYGYLNLLLAAFIVVFSMISFLTLSGEEAKPPMVLAFTAAAIAVGFHLYQGVYSIVSFIVEANCPGTLLGGKHAIEELIINRAISHTYDRPKNLLAMIVVHFYPRMLFLTPSRRRIFPGPALCVSLILGAVMLPISFGVWGGIVILPLLIAMVVRLAALFQSTLISPTTDHVVERRLHLGDKGDPIGLHEHSKRLLECFRLDSFQNRYIADSPPHVSELGQDSRVESFILCETQPRPKIKSHLTNDSIITGAGAMGLTLAGWMTALFITPSLLDQLEITTISFGLASICSIFSGSSLLLLTKGLLSTFRFESDLYLLECKGSYNTTKVGLHQQRTSFQSDIYSAVYATRIVSECSLIQHLSTETRFVNSSNVLQMPRYILTTENNEIFESRLNQFLVQVGEYQDEGSHARISTIHPNEIQQHLAITQLTHQAKVTGMNNALNNGIPSSLPCANASSNQAGIPITLKNPSPQPISTLQNSVTSSGATPVAPPATKTKLTNHKPNQTQTTKRKPPPPPPKKK